MSDKLSKSAQSSHLHAVLDDYKSLLAHSLFCLFVLLCFFVKACVYIEVVSN